MPTSCPQIEKYLEVQYQCQKKKGRLSQNKRVSRQPHIEGNISQMWNNDGRVLAEDMFGKFVHSILEQKFKADPVSIYSDSETMDHENSEFFSESNLTKEGDISITIQRRHKNEDI